eukprot:UN12635
MINENNGNLYGVHKYPPFYWTKHVFPALFGYDDMMDDTDMDTDTDTDSDEEKYSDRNQLVAFLLSLFLGQLGFGRFYVGEYIGASLKLVLLLMACCLPIFIPCTTAVSAASDGVITAEENTGIMASAICG